MSHSDHSDASPCVLLYHHVISAVVFVCTFFWEHPSAVARQTFGKVIYVYIYLFLVIFLQNKTGRLICLSDHHILKQYLFIYGICIPLKSTYQKTARKYYYYFFFMFY